MLHVMCRAIAIIIMICLIDALTSFQLTSVAAHCAPSVAVSVDTKQDVQGQTFMRVSLVPQGTGDIVKQVRFVNATDVSRISDVYGRLILVPSTVKPTDRSGWQFDVWPLAGASSFTVTYTVTDKCGDVDLVLTPMSGSVPPTGRLEPMETLTPTSMASSTP